MVLRFLFGPRQDQLSDKSKSGKCLSQLNICSVDGFLRKGVKGVDPLLSTTIHDHYCFTYVFTYVHRKIGILAKVSTYHRQKIDVCKHNRMNRFLFGTWCMVWFRAAPCMGCKYVVPVNHLLDAVFNNGNNTGTHANRTLPPLFSSALLPMIFPSWRMRDVDWHGGLCLES